MEDTIEESFVVRRLQVEVESLRRCCQADWHPTLMQMPQEPFSTCANKSSAGVKAIGDRWCKDWSHMRRTQGPRWCVRANTGVKSCAALNLHSSKAMADQTREVRSTGSICLSASYNGSDKISWGIAA